MKKLILTAAVLACMAMSACAGSETSSAGADSSAAETEAVTTTAAAATKAEASETTLATTAAQTVNEQPVSYESLGADKEKKEAFKEKLTAECSLPVINLTTAKSDYITSLEKYTPCVVDVFNCEEGQIISEASAGVKVRGNSSAFYGDVAQILANQVPYRIKFDKKTNMLGLNSGAECKSWVLLNSDWDLIRNDIALRFGRAIMEPDGYYCSDSRHVLVYVNDVFKGIYVLCEQCQINPSRVDVTEPEEGYTGTDYGYYLELDNYAASDENNKYITLDYGEYQVTDIQGTERQFVPAEYSIKNEVYTQEQIDFIDKYMNNLFEIVYQACEQNKYYTFDENYDLKEAEFTDAEETVSAVMDVKSVVDMYLLYEIVHDYDCGEGSFFMCVDFAEGSRYPKLSFTSPWDFNWAYNDSTKRYWAAAFTEKSFVKKYGDRSNPWFIVLMKQDWFADMVREKWAELSAADAIGGCIRAETDILEEHKDDLCRTDEWAVENAYKLLEWINKRIDWMDETFGASL